MRSYLEDMAAVSSLLFVIWGSAILVILAVFSPIWIPLILFLWLGN